MSKRIIIAVGGTAGHVYPAMAFASTIKKRAPDAYLFFAGGGLEDNRFFRGNAFPFNEVACGTFPLKKPFTSLKNSGKTLMGILQSVRIIRRVKPDIIVGFGSYHSFPMMMAARLLKIPYFLYESNTIPGKVNRFLSKGAVTTGILFPSAAGYLKGKAAHISMPLKVESAGNTVSREEARLHYQLDPYRFTLLVFGGSQGAAALNKMIPEAFLSYSNDTKGLQVIHLTGDKERSKEVKKWYHDAGILACVKDYEEEMAYAWKAADLLISRAGAGTISEAIAYELPGILIPYPFATDNHQEKNAAFMAETIGGAIKIEESESSPHGIAQLVVQLMQKDNPRLKQMRGAIQKYKEEREVKDFCSLVMDQLV